MPATILDGKALARKIRDQIKTRVERLQALGVQPRLDAIVASQDPASMAYVSMKQKWCAEAGIASEAFYVTHETTQDELIKKIRQANENEAVHGVLLQHPLPPHLDEDAALLALGPEKDVDGITPQSLGRLVGNLIGFRSATPLGMMKLLDEYEIDITGKRVVVVGRSVILGKPAALMLLAKDATVTIAHSKTKDLPELCRTADILVAAVGRAEMIKGSWLKQGAVVLDAGYNRVEGCKHDVGDVEFTSALEVVSHITPVPGGVGPMTVASLLSNAVDAAEALVATKV